MGLKDLKRYKLENITLEKSTIEEIIKTWNSIGFNYQYEGNVRNLSLAFQSGVEFILNHETSYKTQFGDLHSYIFPAIRRIFREIKDDTDMELDYIKEVVLDIINTFFTALNNLECDFSEMDKSLDNEAIFVATISDNYKIKK